MSILKVRDKDGKFVDVPVISGRPASIRVGEVKLLEPNSEPTIENVGTEYDAIFDFGIPKGEYIIQGEDFRLDLSDYAKQKQLDKEIQNRQQTDTNLQSQIKSLASGSPLVASSISEMTDKKRVYVNTTDGNWYYYNGESWSVGGVYQGNEHSLNDIKPFEEEIILKNSIIPPNNWVSGKIINSSGEIISYSNCSTSSNYIEVNENENYTLVVLEHLQELWDINLRIAAYTKDETFIKLDNLILFGGNIATYTVPENCKYLKMSVVGISINDYYPNNYPTLIKTSLINTLIDYTKNQYLNPKYSLLNNDNVIIQDKIMFYPVDKDNKAYPSYQIIKNKYKMQYKKTISEPDYPFFTVYCNELKANDKLRIKLSNKANVLSVVLYPFNNTTYNYDFTYNSKTDEYELFITSEMIENCVTDNKFRIVTRIGNINSTTNMNFDLIVNINDEYNNFTDIINTAKKDKYRNSIISIIGDSYSTYGGWLPDNYASWYNDNGNTNQNNVTSVEQTWWYKLIKQLNATLLVNNSYSGSTICNTGYSGADSTSTSFITRMKIWMGEQRKTEPKPNIIIIMGGTNDRWAGSPIGELKYSDWTEEDLKQVLPAFCYMLDYLKKWNPTAKIINVVNTDLGTAIPKGMTTACEHYEVINVTPSIINKDSGHPNQNGMNQILEAILNVL